MVGKVTVMRRLIFRINFLMTSLPCTKYHSLGHCEQHVATLIHHKHISTRGQVSKTYVTGVCCHPGRPPKVHPAMLCPCVKS